jgi:hypothetical protein
MVTTFRLSFFFVLLTAFFSCRAPEMITISKVEGSKILKLDQTGIEMEVSLRIKNPNRIGFNIYKSSNLNATVNGMDLGRLKISRRIHIGATSDDVHTFTLSSDFSKMGLADLPKLLMHAWQIKKRHDRY